MNKPLLSIIIISHNQRDELIRCVDSVLAQDIPFEYEIILSDDRSTDGTFGVANEYASKYPFIIATQCNSNECNPINTSERSGWNRCNGYKYAKGKYIVHIDGDDYFKGTDCLRLQVELLEQYSECSMCMQNIWCIEAGTPELHGSSWHALHKYHTGQIVTAKDFFLNQMYLLNQAFVMRRNDQIDPVKLYGKYYVDDIITFHHLQFGPIVCLDRCDYVYVINPKSIIRSYSNQVERDLILTLDLTVFASHFVPMFTELYFTISFKDMTPISVVVPPISTIILADGSAVCNPTPKAAVFIVDSIYTFLAPIFNSISLIISFSNAVMFCGQLTKILGFIKRPVFLTFFNLF